MRRVLLVLAACSLAACGGREGEAPRAETPGPATSSPDPALFAPLPPPPRPPAHVAREGASEKGLFVATWTPSPDPIPLDRPFTLSLRVTDAAGRELPSDTEVKVNAGMPGHGHGMTVTPITTRLDDSRFHATGLLFHMPGAWELAIETLRDGVATDVARFAIEIPPHRESLPGAEPPVAFTAAERDALLSLSPKPPPPPDETNRVADDPCAAHLGQFLFFETSLSANGQVACATCHVPALAFTNGQRLGQGMGATARHVPSILNSAHERWWFWDGRADSAWAQALGPLEAGVEHGGSRVRYARALFESAELRAAYESIFEPLPPMDDVARFPPDARPDIWDRFHPHVAAWKAMAAADQEAVTRVHANVGKSIAAYERRLAAGEAPFDAFVRGLRGDAASLSAISPAAQRGARVFVGKGRCLTCHHGPLLTDFEFHDLYLVNPIQPPRDTGRFRGIDLVRRDEFNALGPHADATGGPAAAKLIHLGQQPENWGQFKTAGLRNVAVTAPYMHDGRFATLADVLHYYRTFEGAIPPTTHSERTLQRVDLTDEETADLIAFLESLTEAPRPADLLRKPSSPLLEGCSPGGP